jgi:hypothetical protein
VDEIQESMRKSPILITSVAAVYPGKPAYRLLNNHNQFQRFCNTHTVRFLCAPIWSLAYLIYIYVVSLIQFAAFSDVQIAKHIGSIDSWSHQIHYHHYSFQPLHVGWMLLLKYVLVSILQRLNNEHRTNLKDVETVLPIRQGA